MSECYTAYLNEHIGNVERAYQWLVDNLPQVVEGTTQPKHDSTKWTSEEYYAYDNYFNGEQTDEVVKEFKLAWLHHIHNNPHHWQHWVLVNDDEGAEALEMPYQYVIEMICDWWAFSWKSGNLNEIFDWYIKHSQTMLLHPITQQHIEHILEMIGDKLNEQEQGINKILQ